MYVLGKSDKTRKKGKRYNKHKNNIYNEEGKSLSDILSVLTEVSRENGANSLRISRLEHDFDALNRLAISVEVLATEQKNMLERVVSIDKKVSELEKIPSKRWNNVIGYISSSGISAAVSFLVARLLG